MIPEDLAARILRLFHVEKWKKHTISTELGVHHSVVTRVLEQDGVERRTQRRPSRLEPYIPFIKGMLEQYPKITASRLYDMVKGRGYEGGPDHFRHEVSKLRPRRRQKEAFLRLKTLPGEEAQVDWAHFGRIQIGKARRQLMAFLMVLSYSRRIFLRFYPGQTTTHFIRGHVAAFKEFDSVPRLILYDNLKSAVIDRRGDAIQFNSDLIALSAHYRFEPRPCAPYRGNEKGRVERAVRYVRTAFFEALEWRDLDDLNEKARIFCQTKAMERAWPEDRTRTVADAFLEERVSLIPLPDAPFPTFEREEVSVQKTPYVRLDLNDYSVPHELVGKSLTVVATMKTVRVLCGTQVVAQHRRSFDRDRQIEDPRHLEALVAMKRRARKGRGLDRLQRAVPQSQDLLKKMAERGKNIGSATFALLKLLDTYGKRELSFGIQEALGRGVFHPHAVRHSIEKRREEQGQLPILPVPLPDDPRVQDLTVTPHSLAQYDQEVENEQKEDDEEDAPEEGDARGPLVPA